MKDGGIAFMPPALDMTNKNEKNRHKSEPNRALVSIAVSFVNWPSSFYADQDCFTNCLLLNNIYVNKNE